ncbi:MAG TPA: ABC transporter ATP-binding protein [Blastocatellia bacterium]|nr:ABC transporter ATP-binding protein [Blastocatellia bacterium]
MEPVYEVEIEEVTKRFGEVTAVDSVSLSVLRGEFLTLLGPSGCGKTTLLRMIAGFEAPDAGRVILGGREVTELSPHQRNVTTVFQHYALFPHMSVYRNVAFGLERRRFEQAEIKRRVGAALELVRLAGLDERQPAELSGGQQQRVALARALVVEPRVLLLDEPLAALDLKLRKQMQLELKRLQRRLGISFIYVTHDQEEALTMSDRIVVMNAGRIEQIGRAEEIYERPLTEFVAGFIGVSNILEGAIESVADGTSVVRIGDANISVPTGDVGAGARVRVLVRPEKISISTAAAPSTVRGKIESAVYLGESTQWRVSVGNGQIITVLEQNREPFQAIETRIGRAVFLSWEPQSAVILKQ